MRLARTACHQSQARSSKEGEDRLGFCSADVRSVVGLLDAVSYSTLSPGPNLNRFQCSRYSPMVKPHRLILAPFRVFLLKSNGAAAISSRVQAAERTIVTGPVFLVRISAANSKDP